MELAMDKSTIAANALIGEAIGDAFGVPFEFLPRDIVRFIGVGDEMIGCDSERKLLTKWGEIIPAGAWSDDTSMTLASMSSFIENNGHIDFEDHIRRFVAWWNDSKYCCLDFAFGLGGTVGRALERYLRGTPALDCGSKDEMSNGNGSLMRILPFASNCIFTGLDNDKTADLISDASRITHGHDISKLCCCVWTEFLRILANGGDVDEAVSYIETLDYGGRFSTAAMDALSFIWTKQLKHLTENDIIETGGVVDTLKTAFFCLINGSDYRTSIINAVNLGCDTDTSAAVTGCAAGIIYGINGIPASWLEKLVAKDMLIKAATKFGSLF